MAYPGRDDIPSGKLALRLPRPKDGVTEAAIAKARKTLADHSGGRNLILSEENISGRMMHFMSGRFYPAAEARCAVLRAAWDGPIAHVLFVVRPYDELFVSGYRKRAEDNAVEDFEALRPHYLSMDRGWPELVAVMRDVLRPETMTVIPYAERGTSAALLARMVPGLDAGALKEPQRVMNLSATDAALEALQVRYRAGETLNRAAWQEIVGAHKDDRAPRGFAAFSDAEKHFWSERYTHDLDVISKMDGISFG
ncbi:hypothetical protein [Tateyamaria sp.]|uniref:hypothetical protein n=1 Tax=Tateyamaria sp. TaxID=1929288 RepID=UPI003B21F463